MATKQSRKELLKKEDAFLSAANQGAQWVSDHKGLVAVFAVAVFLAVAAVLGGRAWIGQQNLVASTELHDAEKVLEADVVDPEEADPNADPPTFPSEEERAAAAREALREVIDAGASSGLVSMARMYLGDVEAEAGNTGEAMEIFGQILHDIGRGDSLYFLVAERLAYLREEQGDLAGAIEALDPLVQEPGAFYGDRARYHQARLYAEQGNEERAINLLEHIQEHYEDSKVADPAKRLLDELTAGPSAQAESGAAPEAAPQPSKALAEGAQGAPAETEGEGTP